jgi:hypothetical protein
MYVVSIIWMIGCTIDIKKFRRQWLKITEIAENQEEYMGIAERHANEVFYFPNEHNTGGLFMRAGAGCKCSY